MRLVMLNAVSALLDAGWSGTYGRPARLGGSHPRAIGACVRAYARRHPG
jgi:hypothetical protein